MNADDPRFDDLTQRVLGAVFEVSNALKCGFPEKVYERALLRELQLQGIGAAAQVSFSVRYKGFCVGSYCGDIVVERELLVELKCVDFLASEHRAQCLNYLRVSGLTRCLPVNFQKPRVEWERLVLSGD